MIFDSPTEAGLVGSDFSGFRANFSLLRLLTSRARRIICYYMKCTSDPAKRAKTLAERGLDLEADGAEILAGATLTFEDDRYDYGETRLISIGHLKGRMMVMVWTPRGETAHVISMRKANAREQKAYAPRF